MGNVKRKMRILTLLIVMIVTGLCAAISCGTEDYAEKEIEGIYAADIEIVYDGEPHGIKIENVLAEDRIKYLDPDSGEWTEKAPKYVDPGEYEIVYRVERSGYKSAEGRCRLTINKAILTGIEGKNTTVVYDGKAHGIELEGTLPGDIINYSADGKVYIAELFVTDVGEYTVYYSVERLYGEYKGSCVIKIVPDVRGRYLNGEHGTIIVTETTVIDGEFEHAISNREITGEFTADGKEYRVNDGKLTYNGKVFDRLGADESVCKVIVGSRTVYVGYRQGDKAVVKFDGIFGIVEVNGTEIARERDVNYCENGRIIDYISLDTEIELGAETEIILTKRAENDIADIYNEIMYDGEAHGFDIEGDGKYEFITDGEYNEESPVFTEPGRYEVNVLVTDVGKLPKIITAVLEIMPDLTGTYYDGSDVIEIDGRSAKTNGVSSEYVYGGGNWALDGLSVKKTDGGIAVGQNEYALLRNGKIVSVECGGERKATVYPDLTDIVIIIDSTGITVTVNGDQAYFGEPMSGDPAVTVNGKELTGISDDADSTVYIIGTDELYSDVIFISIGVR